LNDLICPKEKCKIKQKAVLFARSNEQQDLFTEFQKIHTFRKKYYLSPIKMA